MPETIEKPGGNGFVFDGVPPLPKGCQFRSSRVYDDVAAAAFEYSLEGIELLSKCSVFRRVTETVFHVHSSNGLKTGNLD